MGEPIGNGDGSHEAASGAAPLVEAMARTGKGTQASSEAGRSRPLAWADAAQRLAGGGWFWLATVQPDGAPHVVPVLAAWADPVLYVASKATARKSRNLAIDHRCVLTKDAGDAHLVLEARARRVTEPDELQRASEAFLTTYGWPTTVVGDELDAEYGAPTSGGPPYGVFELAPTKGFGFPTDGESLTPTRWRFPSPARP